MEEIEKNLKFTNNLLSFEEVNFFINLFSELKKSFIQRKEYEEYNYKETKININLNKLDILIKEYEVIISSDEIIVKN